MASTGLFAVLIAIGTIIATIAIIATNCGSNPAFNQVHLTGGSVQVAVVGGLEVVVVGEDGHAWIIDTDAGRKAGELMMVSGSVQLLTNQEAWLMYVLSQGTERGVSGVIQAINITNNHIEFAAVTGIYPVDAVIVDSMSLVLVLDQGSNGAGSLSIFDARSGVSVGKVTVGAHPAAVAVDESGALAIVANYVDDSLTLVDLRNPEAPATVEFGPYPGRLAMVFADSEQSRVAAVELSPRTLEGEEGEGRLWLVNTETRTVEGKVEITNPVAAELEPRSHLLLIGSAVGDTGHVTGIDITSGAVRLETPVPVAPSELLIDPVRGTVLAMSYKRGSGSLLNTANGNFMCALPLTNGVVAGALNSTKGTLVLVAPPKVFEVKATC